MTEKEKKRYRKILFKIYEALYKKSTPSADFYELLEKSPWCSLEEGKYVEHPESAKMTHDECIANGWVKKIPYDDYTLDSDIYDETVTKILKRYKLEDHERKALRFEAYLGCGPTAKIKTEILEEAKDDE